MKVISHISFRHWDFKCLDNEGKKSRKFTHTRSLFPSGKRNNWFTVSLVGSLWNPFLNFLHFFFFNLKRNRIWMTRAALIAHSVCFQFKIHNFSCGRQTAQSDDARRKTVLNIKYTLAERCEWQSGRNNFITFGFIIF